MDQVTAKGVPRGIGNFIDTNLLANRFPDALAKVMVVDRFSSGASEDEVVGLGVGVVAALEHGQHAIAQIHATNFASFCTLPDAGIASSAAVLGAREAGGDNGGEITVSSEVGLTFRDPESKQ